jgi:hypothetical protein
VKSQFATNALIYTTNASKLLFGLCWLPIHVFTLILDFKPEILRYETVDDAMALMIFYLSVHWLAMSNSFANPLIYGFTNANFRVSNF